MDQNTEFINLYISKQKALIDDFQSRLLLCETKLTITESKLSEANKVIESFNKKNAKKVENE